MLHRNGSSSDLLNMKIPTEVGAIRRAHSTGDSIVQRQGSEHDDVTRPPAPTVWLVDDDLGFVYWLGSIFTEAGCRALPALSCREAVALMKRLGIEPDLIVLNPHLPGVDRMLQGRVRHPKIVTIGAPPEALATSIPIHARLERPFVKTQGAEITRSKGGQTLCCRAPSTSGTTSIVRGSGLTSHSN